MGIIRGSCQVGYGRIDKTGTITKGIFAVDTVVNAEGVEDDILYLAAHLESYSNHPIANSIRTAYGQEVDENRVESDYRATRAGHVR